MDCYMSMLNASFSANVDSEYSLRNPVMCQYQTQQQKNVLKACLKKIKVVKSVP